MLRLREAGEVGSSLVVLGAAGSDAGTLLAVDTVRRLREVSRLPVRVVGVPGIPSLNVHPAVGSGVADVVLDRPWGVLPPYGLAHRLTWLSGVALAEADELLRAWRRDVARWAEEASKPMCAEVVAGVLDALEDDLDTRTAVAVLRGSTSLGLPGGCLFETWAWADRLLGLDLAADVGR